MPNAPFGALNMHTIDGPERWPSNRWPNFTWGEFVCKFTGTCVVNYDYMDALQAMRSEWNKPIIVRSGYRSIDHPQERGKAEPGTHSLALAGDYQFTSHDLYDFLEMVFRHKQFTGIGISQAKNFIHLDMGHLSGIFKQPRPHAWSYPE